MTYSGFIETSPVNKFSWKYKTKQKTFSGKRLCVCSYFNFLVIDECERPWTLSLLA